MRYTDSARIVGQPLPSGRSLPALIGHLDAVATSQLATKQSGARKPVGIYIEPAICGFGLPESSRRTFGPFGRTALDQAMPA